MLPDPVALAKSELRKARAAALASLPAELREALAREAQDRIAKRGKRRQSRRLRLVRAIFVVQRSLIGDTPEEIAEKLDISVWALRKFCSRLEVSLVQRKGFRRIGTWLDERLVCALDSYAEAAGMSREKAASELLSNALRTRQARRAAA